MIKKSLELQQKLAQLNKSDRRKEEISQIKSTNQELEMISTNLYRLINQYNTIGNLLIEEDRQSLIGKFETIYQKIKEFDEDFQENSNQARKLRPFNTYTIADSINTFEYMWSAYVNSAISNESGIYLLVKSLPDIQANSATIEYALRRIANFKKHPPTTEAELTEFQAECELLKSHIGNIKGLTTEVQFFLKKMANNSATIADLTPEVLAWCSEVPRATHFAIRFAERG